MGPGWPTPYNLIVVARNRPITTPSLLAGISGLQQQIARDKTVESVTGPAAIKSSTKDLSQFWPGIKHSVKISDQSKKDLLTLINGLGLAGSGASQLQSGLSQAASGAGQIHGGN